MKTIIAVLVSIAAFAPVILHGQTRISISNNDIILDWTCAPAEAFRIDHRVSLDAATPWTPLVTDLTAPLTYTASHRHTNALAASSGFYAVSPVITATNFQLAADYSTGFGGRAVLVMQHGNILFERNEPPYDANTVHYLHSATKSFWGPALAAMVQDGLISSYDEPAWTTLPEWEADPQKKKVTIRQLMHLVSGLDEDIRMLQGPYPGAPNTYAYAITLPIVKEPGTFFRYGPSHFYVLGEIMRRKLLPLGEDPLDYLHRRVLDPAGIEISQWLRDAAGNPNIPNGAYITARNWAKFGQFVAQHGAWDGQQIVNRALLDECIRPGSLNLGYGLTFWMNGQGGHSISPGAKAPPGSPGGWIYWEDYTDIAGALGAGKNRLYVIPSIGMVVIRHGEGDTENGGFMDDTFLRLLFTGQQVPVHVQLGTAGSSYIDPEVHSATGKITWQDSDETIWMADLDALAGTLAPGSETLLDTGAYRMSVTFNGPEFGWDSAGWAVFYTKKNGSVASLWRATVSGATVTAVPLTSGQWRQTPLASKDTNSSSTLLVYAQGTLQTGQLAWLDEANPGAETVIGAIDDGVRWINDTRKVALVPPTGTNAGRVMLYDAPGNSFQTVASDAGAKSYAYGWPAPEAGGRLRVLALVDAQSIAVYEQAADSSWSRVATLQAPGRAAGWTYGSPEPFVAGGRSYVSLVIGQPPPDGTKPYYNEVWVLGMDGTALRCDDGRPQIRRTDPEWFLGAEQVFIIYNIVTESGTYEMWRSATGISTQ